MNGKWSFVLTVCLSVIILAVFVGAVLLYNECPECKLKDWIDYILGIAVALLLTIIITWRQDLLAHRTHEIAEDTHEIAAQITGERNKQKNITRFFVVGKVGEINLHVPKTQHDGGVRKPLPILNTGDSFGYSILAELIGSERLLPRFHETRDLAVEIDHSAENPYKKEIKEGSNSQIILCSPRSNLVLDSLAPVIENETTGPLPVWFQFKPEGSVGAEKKYVQIVTKKRVIYQSPADDVYHKTASDPNYTPSEEPLEDFGIIARLTHESLHSVPMGKTVIVIAGIHQYGTWIASEFVRRNVQPTDKASNLFAFAMENSNTPDFICVVHGKFLPQQSSARSGFRVDEIVIEDLWIHEQGEWVSNMDMKGRP